jgi:hypothetical protein
MALAWSASVLNDDIDSRADRRLARIVTAKLPTHTTHGEWVELVIDPVWPVCDQVFCDGFQISAMERW